MLLPAPPPPPPLQFKNSIPLTGHAAEDPPDSLGLTLANPDDEADPVLSGSLLPEFSGSTRASITSEWSCCTGNWLMETYPPSPCENNTKIPLFDGTNTEHCSDKRGGGGVFMNGKEGVHAPHAHQLLTVPAPRQVFEQLLQEMVYL